MQLTTRQLWQFIQGIVNKHRTNIIVITRTIFAQNFLLSFGYRIACCTIKKSDTFTNSWVLIHITGHITFVSLHFFSKTGFVDTVPLCCKPSLSLFWCWHGRLIVCVPRRHRSARLCCISRWDLVTWLQFRRYSRRPTSTSSDATQSKHRR